MDFCEFFSHSSYEVVTDHNSLTDLAPQVFLLLQLAPPVLGALTVWRLMERPGSVIWTVIVLHSNIVLWSGIHIACHLSPVCTTSFLLQVLSPDHAQHSLLQGRGRGQVRRERLQDTRYDIILVLDIGITLSCLLLSPRLST